MIETMAGLLSLEWGAELLRVKPPIFITRQNGKTHRIQILFGKIVDKRVQLMYHVLDTDWVCLILPDKEGNNVVLCKTDELKEKTVAHYVNIYDLAGVIKWKTELFFKSENPDLLYASGGSL